MSRRLAITGGLAEGKSTVLGYCRDAGFSVASADRFAADVFDLPEVQTAIADLLEINGPPTKEQVREALVARPSFRRSLNRITHPRIIQRIRSCPAMILEVPLLIETCLQAEFDCVWVVTCGAEEQFARLEKRLGASLAAQLLRTQLPTCAKTPFADRIIRTNDNEETVKGYVLGIVKNDLGDLRFE